MGALPRASRNIITLAPLSLYPNYGFFSNSVTENDSQNNYMESLRESVTEDGYWVAVLSNRQ